MRSGMVRRRAVWVAILCAAAAGVAWGCRRGSDEGNGPGGVNPKTLQETVWAMRAWYQCGAYARLRPYIDPAENDHVIDMLLALDELMAANAGALAAIRAACPQADVSPFDLGYLRDWMDLFSRELAIVGEERTGDRAVVTAQVGNRVPLIRLHFAQRAGRWVYLPGPVPPEAVAAVRRLARSLDLFRLVVDSQRHVTVKWLEHEYHLRIRPKLEQLIRIADAQGEVSHSFRPQ